MLDAVGAAGGQSKAFGSMSNRLPYGNSLMVSTWIISFEKN